MLAFGLILCIAAGVLLAALCQHAWLKGWTWAWTKVTVPPIRDVVARMVEPQASGILCELWSEDRQRQLGTLRIDARHRKHRLEYEGHAYDCCGTTSTGWQYRKVS